MRKWFNAKREKGSKTATVRIFDQIGDNWFGEGTTAKGFVTEVDALGDDIETLNIHINSPGGNVYDGLAIYNYLKRHAAEVVVYVDGIAASIASVIAMAGDRIVMPANASMFIHNPWTFAGGNAEALRKTAEELDTLRGSLLGVYMTRVSIDEADVVAMMDDETMLTAEEAVEWGFADELEQATKMAAMGGSPEAAVEISRLVAEHELAARIKDEEIETLTKLTLIAQEASDEAMSALAAMQAEHEAPTPMPATDVIALVTERQAPEWLATRMIQTDAPQAQVENSLVHYSGVMDACAAAGIQEAADAICRDNWDDPAALVSALLVEALASLDNETSNRHPPEAGVGGQHLTFDHRKIYANRKPTNSKESQK